MIDINFISDYLLLYGDCLDLMKDIPDNSIDCIIADLPFGTTECRWDTTIPLESLWQNYKRIISINGVIALFSSQPFTSILVNSNLDWFRYEWIWVKTKPTGFLEAKNKPLKTHENIVVFSPGKYSNGCLNRMTYNPQELIKVNKFNTNHNVGGAIFGERKNRPDGKIVKQEFTNYPNSVLTYPKDNERHPSAKPVPLLEYLIKTYSETGDIILDNVFGSCSSGEAALRTNRRFIGIEKDADYFYYGNKRMLKVKNELGLLSEKDLQEIDSSIKLGLF